MSFDLGIFSIKPGTSASEIRAAYLDSCAGNQINWPSSADFDSFVAALEEKYPSIDSLPDDRVDESPWSCDFGKGNGHIILSMVFSRAPEVGNFIWSVLEKHQLIVFDPQADKAYLGNAELPDNQHSKKWWKFWK